MSKPPLGLRFRFVQPGSCFGRINVHEQDATLASETALAQYYQQNRHNAKFPAFAFKTSLLNPSPRDAFDEIALESEEHDQDRNDRYDDHRYNRGEVGEIITFHVIDA